LSAEWKELSAEAGLEANGDAIHVSLGERSHKVIVDDTPPDAIYLSSIVVPRRYAPPDAALQLWKMNRFRELVGFKIVEHGRVIGECWVPRVGISADEWKLYVMTLARACDRLEYLWTGRDVG
jgi:hypothetical protein